MFKVIDNLLDKDSFKRVHDMFYNNENFPWFSTPVLDYKEHKQFVHFFYYDHKPNSIYNEILKPIYNLLGVYLKMITQIGRQLYFI